RIRLATTGNSLRPTSSTEIHAPTTRSKTRRKISLSRNRSLRARENAEGAGILPSMLMPQNQRYATLTLTSRRRVIMRCSVQIQSAAKSLVCFLHEMNGDYCQMEMEDLQCRDLITPVRRGYSRGYTASLHLFSVRSRGAGSHRARA